MLGSFNLLLGIGCHLHSFICSYSIEGCFQSMVNKDKTQKKLKICPIYLLSFIWYQTFSSPKSHILWKRKKPQTLNLLTSEDGPFPHLCLRFLGSRGNPLPFVFYLPSPPPVPAPLEIIVLLKKTEIENIHCHSSASIGGLSCQSGIIRCISILTRVDCSLKSVLVFHTKNCFCQVSTKK